MNPVEKIRHAPLAEAVKLLAYRNAMQTDPVLLLFLQNLTERVCDDVVQRQSLEREIHDLWERINRSDRKEHST